MPNERVSYEEAVELNKAGWPHRGNWAWSDHTQPPTLWDLDKMPSHNHPAYYAPSAVEVLEELPMGIDRDRIAYSLQINRNYRVWMIGYVNFGGRFLADVQLEDATLADAASRMWRELKSKGVIK
jgi:hypothetical protein